MRLVRAVVVSILLLGVTACASRAVPEAMVVEPSASLAASASEQGQYFVGDVIGGEETSPLWTSEVDNEGFRQALSDSLVRTGYSFSAATDGPRRIDVTLVSIDQPMFGLTFSVTAAVNYTITGAGLGQPKTFNISETGTATFGDQPLGVERLRVANERAIQANIRAFLQRLKVEGSS
jgi:hypothetical protein